MHARHGSRCDEVLLERRRAGTAMGVNVSVLAYVHGLALAGLENELGVLDPVGFWDPLGFTSDGNAENFRRRRQAELRHDRISILAAMGCITPVTTGKLPGYLSPPMGTKFVDVRHGLAAISKVPTAGWALIFAYGVFCELSRDQSAGTPGGQGDLGFKVLTSSDPPAVEDQVERWAGDRPPCHKGDHQDVVPGWPFRVGLERLGVVYGLALAGL